MRFGVTSNKVLALLAFASWLLLGVSWVMSLYAYPRLPAQVAIWTTLWSSDAVREVKSAAFFVYPLAQTLFFLAFLGLAKALFFRVSGSDPEERSPGNEGKERLLALKKEVAYLALIFLNLVFIHLQTSLILISHGLATGINRFYFAMLLVVLLMMIPYYRVRRQMLRAASNHEE
jgi:hypothetical protein